jgi:hypothetical protein
MIPKLTKYIELKEQGSSASEVAVAAREDGLNSVESIYVLKYVFDLSVEHAKETWINAEGNEHHRAFQEQLIDELEQEIKESELEHQGGIS